MARYHQHEDDLDRDYFSDDEENQTKIPVERDQYHRGGQVLPEHDYPLPEKYMREVPKHDRHQASLESLSSIRSRTQDRPLEHPDDIHDIYLELQHISGKLKGEFRVLQERDAALKEKEQAVQMKEANIDKAIEERTKHRLLLMEEEQKMEIGRMDQILKEKTRENKRLKDNFDTLKTANEALKRQLEDLQQQHARLEKQSTGLQARLTNLQRKQEYAERKETEHTCMSEQLKERRTRKDGVKATGPKSSGKPSLNTYDVLAILLEWISDVHLRHSITDQPTKPLEKLSSSEFIQNKCLKVLPCLVDILRDVPSTNQQIALPCLQFVYWALLHIELVQGPQKTSLSSTLRRLGEELYKPKQSKCGPEAEISIPHADSVSHGRQDKVKDGMYFKSTNLHIRFLSSLIILKTLTQVDHLANVFDVMRHDLKSEPTKELFLHYQATPILLPYLRPMNKALLNSALDVCLQMAMESVLLQGFLDSCSTEAWFRTCSLVFRAPNVDERVLEKLSIILQKLSKNRSNKKYFEVFSITKTAQEMVRTSGNENAFLILNLKSILFNLTSGKKEGVS